MSKEDYYVRFLIKEDGTHNFVYRPPDPNSQQDQNATSSVKFSNSSIILDDWWIVGGTRWGRTLFRLKHPIVYTKRGLHNLRRRIKRFFFGDPPMYMYRKWVDREELLNLYPQKLNDNNLEPTEFTPQD